MAITGERGDDLRDADLDAGSMTSWRRARPRAGRWLVRAAAGYAVLVLLASVLMTWSAVSDYDQTGALLVGELDPLRVLAWPSSILGPGTVVRATDLVGTGVALGLMGLVQAALLGTLGWALLRSGRRRVAPAAVAVLLLGLLALVAVRSYDAPLSLPDRSEPVVQAEEARLATVVAAGVGAADGAEATCTVRLLAQRGDASYVNAHCASAASEGEYPARVVGATVEFPRDGYGADDYDALLPEDVQRALWEQWDQTRP